MFIWPCFSLCFQRCLSLCREVRIRNVRRMWKSDSWPVHTESLPRPGMARSLPEVCRVQPVPGWDLHLFCPGRQNLLQKRLCKVGVWKCSLHVGWTQFNSIRCKWKRVKYVGELMVKVHLKKKKTNLDIKNRKHYRKVLFTILYKKKNTLSIVFCYPLK